MKKGITLRPYQEDAIERALWSIDKFDNNSLVVLPTGSGKSILSAGIADSLNREVLILQPSKEILEQNVDKMKFYVSEDEIGIYSASAQRKDISKYTFATIQSVYKKPELFKHIGVVIIDEAHTMNPKREEGMFTSFLKHIGNPITLGLTATPFRNIPYTRKINKWYVSETSLRLINRINPRFWSRITYNINNHTLVDAGYLTPLTYVDRSKIPHKRIPFNKSGTDFDLIKFQKLFAPLETQIIESIIKAQDHRKAILVFCSSLEQAERFSKAVSYSRWLSGDTPTKERSQLIHDFKSGAIKTVFNYGTLTTGFDHPELDTIYLLRPTKSLGLYYQMCLDEQTEVLTQRGFVGRSEILDSDIIATLNLSTNKGEWKPVLSITDRYIQENETFINYTNHHINICVTDKHDLVVKSRNANKWNKEYAKDSMNRKSMFKLPANVNFDVPDCGLLPHELQFLGLFLSDGYYNSSNKSIVITQSINSPVLWMIENILKKNNFKINKQLNKASDPNHSDKYMFTISASSRDLSKRGWEHLRLFINKNMSSAYENFSKSDISHLLTGIWIGNGMKSVPKTYTKKTICIAGGSNLQYVNTLQSLLVRRGFRCSVSTISVNKRPSATIQAKNSQYILYIKDVEYSCIVGLNDKDRIIDKTKKTAVRSRLIENTPKIIQKVWCVENENGTIITRRNGKVVVMGNCGRGVRTAPNKKECYVLDYSGSFKELGKIEDIKYYNENNYWEVYANGEKWHGKVIYERDL